jgi:hypothetical protein
MKKLIFVLILLFSIDITHRLLLLLPFTWFKSEVKDTVVEPVVIVEKKQIKGFKSEVKDTVVEPVVIVEKKQITGFKSEVKDTVVEPVVQVEKRQMGVLFYRKVNGKWRWHENGNEDYHAKYEGEIKNGKPNGQGTRTYVDKYLGGKYSGGWKDGEFHGQGTETSILGFKYEGGYKDGKKHGQGTYTFSSGGWYDGSWKDGQSWTGITYDKNENITGKWVNGVLQE